MKMTLWFLTYRNNYENYDNLRDDSIQNSDFENQENTCVFSFSKYFSYIQTFIGISLLLHNQNMKGIFIL